MKADYETRVKISDAEKKITIQLSNMLYKSFQAGKSNYEVYLPKTDTWCSKLFVRGWILKPHLLSYEVVIVPKNKSSMMRVKLVGATVRYMPIRQMERVDKHIVLYTKIIKNEQC